MTLSSMTDWWISFTDKITCLVFRVRSTGSETILPYGRPTPPSRPGTIYSPPPVQKAQRPKPPPVSPL